tara:strand:+ start:1255 stop:1467 length:213 start_codon:yes stop_codon:yes gene_type:complete
MSKKPMQQVLLEICLDEGLRLQREAEKVMKEARWMLNKYSLEGFSQADLTVMGEEGPTPPTPPEEDTSHG